MKLLLLMTPSMSLKKWNDLGQLSRELNIYNKLCQKVGDIYIYSYGIQEDYFVKDIQAIKVISKKSRLWRPIKLPGFITKYINYAWNTINLVRYWRIFQSIDIVKTNQFQGAIFGVVIKILYRKKLAIRMGWYHSHFKKNSLIKKYIEKFCFYFSDILLVTNKDAINYICSEYNLPPSKVSYLPNSIDTDQFYPYKTKKYYDLIYVGRFESEKNTIEILKSISLFTKYSLKVLFIGDGKQKREILDIAQNNNIDLKIISRVNNSKLPFYYNSSRMFILPSLYEGNPKTLLEAMSCSLPVIASNVPGIKEIISPGYNGYLFEPHSDSIYNTLVLYLNDKKNNIKKIKKNARQYILANHSLDLIISKESDIYYSLINQ